MVAEDPVRSGRREVPSVMMKNGLCPICRAIRELRCHRNEVIGVYSIWGEMLGPEKPRQSDC